LRRSLPGPDRPTMSRDSSYKSGQDWSIMDVEDLRDFAKAMTIDDLTIIMARSRQEIQKKLVELGLSAVKSGPNHTDES
jgi:hypothetical protein